jgi:hypothetical protein
VLGVRLSSGGESLRKFGFIPGRHEWAPPNNCSIPCRLEAIEQFIAE